MSSAGADLFDLLPDAVVVLEASPKGKHRVVVGAYNAAAARLIGWDAKEAIGRPATEVLMIRDLGGGNLVGRVPIGQRSTVSRGLPERDYELRRSSGEWIPVTLRCTYERDGSLVVRRTICALRDGRARRGMDMRTVELISTVSHEIRSPLTTVKGFNKTLLDYFDRFPDEQKKEMLRAAIQDADRVTRLLNELLDVSRLEAGRLRLRPERVNITELVRKVVGDLAGRSTRHTIKVRPGKDVPLAMADADKVQQVITNLVENAIKYTDGGAVTVSVVAAKAFVRVRVKDSGEGIPAAQIPRLFRKFVRSERAGSPSGTGLGLYICKGLIEAHGGELTAASVMGSGTTFEFTLPAVGES